MSMILLFQPRGTLGTECLVKSLFLKVLTSDEPLLEGVFEVGSLVEVISAEDFPYLGKPRQCTLVFLNPHTILSLNEVPLD